MGRPSAVLAAAHLSGVITSHVKECLVTSSTASALGRCSALALAAVLAGTISPAQAAVEHERTRGQVAGAPGSVTGYGFDTCTAPAQAVMDAWWQESPYSAVGVYIGGSNRVCKTQTELTAGWVQAQRQTGWHVLPIQVGPQASCSGYADKMSSDLATAEAQGRAEAVTAIATAQSLGIGPQSTLYYDLEDYDIAPDDCRRAALRFLSGWTQELQGAHYRSGVYSNIAAAITSLDYAALRSPGSYVMPDDIWFAWANGQADTVTDARVQSNTWTGHQRIHQYALDTQQSYGGYPLTIDVNWVDVGEGSAPSTSKKLCGHVDVDLHAYPARTLGSHGVAVRAAQCLLRKNHFMKARISGVYDKATAAAVRKAQHKLDQKETGKLTRWTWVALLAKGEHPLVKVGSTGDSVRRLERALTAALRKKVKIDGAFSQKTEKAVRKYQKKSGLPVTGVVTDVVWDRLLSGQ
jgi:peptidoglycan hydrolase-like protein with peptidoglycan-binding domain